MQLMALLVAHWQAQPLATWPVHVISTASATAAVQSLPYTLPALMQLSEWQKAAEPVLRRLIRLAAGCEALQQQIEQEAPRGAGQSDSQKGPSSVAKPNAQKVPHIAAACVVAMRQHLPEDAWQHMPQVLVCIGQYC